MTLSGPLRLDASASAAVAGGGVFNIGSVRSGDGSSSMLSTYRSTLNMTGSGIASGVSILSIDGRLQMVGTSGSVIVTDNVLATSGCYFLGRASDYLVSAYVSD